MKTPFAVCVQSARIETDPARHPDTGHFQQVGDLTTDLAVGDPEHGQEALVDALVVGLVAAALEFLPLLPGKQYRLHRSPLQTDLDPVVTGIGHSLAAMIVG
jgi:hypothetical protein